MDTYLMWKNGFFANRNVIYAGGNSVGELKYASFSRKVMATLYDKKYIFRAKGFFKEYTEVYDDENNNLVGKINHSGRKQPRSLFEDTYIMGQCDKRSAGRLK